MKSFGIFFIAYQERFHASSSEVSLILTISNLTTSFTGKRPISELPFMVVCFQLRACSYNEHDNYT